jgi:hypothetical protein
MNEWPGAGNPGPLGFRPLGVAIFATICCWWEHEVGASLGERDGRRLQRNAWMRCDVKTIPKREFSDAHCGRQADGLELFFCGICDQIL